MNLLLVAATPYEVAPLKDYLDHQFVEYAPSQYQKGELSLGLLITGVGLPLTAYALGRIFAGKRYDLAINAGIAGAFNRKLKLGEVVQVVSERFGDLGVEEADGGFTDVHQLGLIDPDQGPFQQGMLHNSESGRFEFLPRANGISVNRVHGYPPSIERIREKYDVDIESMEGAAFFYACLASQIPFLEIRAVSNYVEARNRENWQVEKAIQNLNEVLVDMVKMFV
jgi:futalosine hydrolase